MNKTAISEVLLENVSKWMTNTMRFKEFKPDFDYDDLKLLCVGRNEMIWKYIISNVKPIKDVKKIRGNLLLRSNQSNILNEEVDDELKYLMEKNDELHKQLIAEEESVELIEVDINGIKKELLANECKLKSQVVSMVTECHSKQLKKKFYCEIEKDKTRMSELASAVGKRSDGLKKNVKNSNNPVIIQDEEDQSDEGVMDRTCYVETRKCCFLVEEYIQSSMHSPCNSFDRPDTLKQLLDSIGELTYNYPAEDIQTSLVKIVSQSNHQLQKAMFDQHCKIIKRESNEIFDSLLQLVKLNMIKEDTEIEKLLNESFSLENQNKRMEEILFSILKQKHPNSTRSLYEVMKRSRASLAIRSSHDQELTRIQQKSQKLQKDNNEMEENNLDLRNFQEVLEINQNIVYQLTNEILESQPKTNQLQTEMNEFVLTNLIGQKEKWVTLIEGSNLLNLKEMNLYSKMGLHGIEFFSNQSQASIHGLLGNNCWPFSNLLLEILDVLKFPLHLSFDEILLHVSSLIAMVGSAGTFEKTNNFSILRNLTEELKDLKKQVEGKEESYIKKCLPLIELSITNAKMLESCPNMKVIFSDWWNQFAQTQVPWVQIDGLNFQEYLDDWRVEASNLRRHKLT